MFKTNVIPSSPLIILNGYMYRTVPVHEVQKKIRELVPKGWGWGGVGTNPNKIFIPKLGPGEV